TFLLSVDPGKPDEMLLRLSKCHERANPKRDHSQADRSADTPMHILPVTYFGNRVRWDRKHIRLVHCESDVGVSNVKLHSIACLEALDGAAIVYDFIAIVGRKRSRGKNAAQNYRDKHAK